jgi:hypothetical protein
MQLQFNQISLITKIIIVKQMTQNLNFITATTKHSIFINKQITQNKELKIRKTDK